MFPPSESEIASWPEFTPERPLRLLVSACLSGIQCGVDGSSYGEEPHVLAVMSLPNVKTFRFCPEDFSFGTPRSMPDIHGGNGFDVLDGKARVLTDKGEDWTAGFLAAAQEMLRIAQKESINLAILQNMSAACGTQVISNGCRLVEHRKYRKGPGVSAALLLRHGFKVMNVYDFRTLELVRRKLDPDHRIDPTAIDWHETAWYRGYFGDSGTSPK